MPQNRTFPESFKDEYQINYDIDKFYINYLIPYLRNHPKISGQTSESKLGITLNQIPERSDKPLLGIFHDLIDDRARTSADGYYFTLKFRDVQSQINNSNKIFSTFFNIHGVLTSKSSFQIFKSNNLSLNCISVVYTENILPPTRIDSEGGIGSIKDLKDSVLRILMQASYVFWIDKKSIYWT